MKNLILLLIIPLNTYANNKEYVVPADVIIARDRAVASSHRFRDIILKRYKQLSLQKDLSIKELNEFKALDSIVNEKIYINPYPIK